MLKGLREMQGGLYVIRILAIDPGLNKTGWAIVDYKDNCTYFVACGTIKTDSKNTLPQRLSDIHHQLEGIIVRFGPHEAAIEETFVNKNPQSSLKLGHARGAIILTLSLAQLSINEYSATNIKKSVVGAGRADKAQIEAMVKMLLPNAKIHGADEADALAVALCHCHHRNLHMLIKAS